MGYHGRKRKAGPYSVWEMMERWRRRERMKRVGCLLISSLEASALRLINFKSNVDRCSLLSHIQISRTMQQGQAERELWDLAFPDCLHSLPHRDVDLRNEESMMVHTMAR